MTGIIRSEYHCYDGFCGKIEPYEYNTHYKRVKFKYSINYNGYKINYSNRVHDNMIEIYPHDSFVCSHCNTKFDSEELFYVDKDGNSYCHKCFEESFDFCNRCRCVTRKEELKGYDGMCKHCYENLPKCEFCGERLTIDGFSFLKKSGEAGYVCKECESSHKVIECAECGENILAEDAYEDDCGFKCLCSNCYSKNRDIVKNYHYHHFAQVQFFGEDKDSPYLGVELEVDRKEWVDCDYENECCRNVISCFPKGFIYMEHDGSLENGFENITSPATFSYHISLLKNYKEAFKELGKHKYLSHKTKTCGLHVHFNRNFYADNEELYITRLLYIVEKFWDKLVIFSRRNIRNINNWAKKYENKPEEIIKSMKENSLSRYYAVNLTNKNTIEFRMFRGTLNIDTFIATLELCNTLILTAKENTVSQIQTMKWEDLLKTDVTKRYWEGCLEREKKREERRKQKL